MTSLTRQLWSKQNQPEGDRQRLFSAVGQALGATSSLYPASYVDIAPSFVFPAVTFVDSDNRARRFFADTSGVLELIRSHRPDGTVPDIRFVHGDYRSDLPLSVGAFDLLISLYAGFVSEHCCRVAANSWNRLVAVSQFVESTRTLLRFACQGSVIVLPGREGLFNR